MCDSSGLYETSCVDTAVASLSAAVRDAMDQAISRGYNRKKELPPWLSNTVRYYIVKETYFHRHFKEK